MKQSIGSEASTEGESAPDRRKWVGYIFLVFGLLVISLDLSIADVALPSIVKDLDISADDASLIITVFMVVAASFMVLMGKVSDVVGAKKAFLVGSALFAAGSLMTGLADGFTALMGGRALQGLVLATAIPASMSLLNHEFPSGRDRTIAFSVWTAVIGSAMALGPLIGGWLCTYVSWRWAFFMNVPIMMVAFVGVFFLVKPVGPQTSTDKFDMLGSILLVIGLALIVFAIQEAATLGWWVAKTDSLLSGAVSWPYAISIVPIGGAIGLLLLILFARWEIYLNLQGRESVLEFSLFRVPSFTWGTAAAAGMTGAVFSLLLIIPLYAQFVLDKNPLGAGLMLVPLGIGMALGGPIIARFSIDASRAVVIFLVVQPIAVLTLIPLISESGEGWWLAPALLVEGFAWGAAYSLLVSMLLADVPTKLSGVAGGTQVAARLIAGALGGALITGLLLGSTAITTKAISESDLTEKQQGELSRLYQFENQLKPPTTNTGQTVAEVREIAEFDRVIIGIKQDMTSGLRWSVVLLAFFSFLGALSGFFLAREKRRSTLGLNNL